VPALERLLSQHAPIDQTQRPGTVAQIQCIVRKEG
jgi:hypothetical protein